jgi:nucleotide-binding universal stress UspA family protein
MDLHTWITQQVDAAEVAARKAADCATARRWEVVGSLIVAVPDENTAGPDIIESTFHTYDDALVHAALHDPAAALRRCEADRRILARHNVDPDEASHHLFATACRGCGTHGDCDDPEIDNINDCPELLDLAHAHGITDEILAGLDRPQPPEPTPAQKRRLRE